MATMPDRPAMIGLLQDDLSGEHAAIVQYLQHAYKMAGRPGLGEIACEVEEIAREEMRHYDWLSELIVDLGGVPTLNRDPIYVNGAPAPRLMQLDIEAEDRAIAQYEAHLAAIGDQKVVTLIRRILSDELAHREQFHDFIGEMGGESQSLSETAGAGPFATETPSVEGDPAAESSGTGVQGDAAAADGQTVQMLNEEISSQYTTVLRYLQHSYLIPDCPISRELLEDRAQWEMKHMGWLAEKVVELGGEPSTEHGEVAVPAEPAEMLKVDLRSEQESTARLQQQAAAIADLEIKGLLERIRGHKLYDELELNEMLSSLGAHQAGGGPPKERGADPRAARGPRLTVGSLIPETRDEKRR